MKAFLYFMIVAILAAAGVSCSEKREASTEAESERSTTEQNSSSSEREGDEEEEAQPERADVAEDCVAFLRLTKAFPSQASDCPNCPTPNSAAEVLGMRDLKVNKIECAGESCEVEATLRAVFNESHGGEIRGGLTGWITPEQQAEYARGKTPPGEQIYKLKISYRRDEIGWRAVEFEKG